MVSGMALELYKLIVHDDAQISAGIVLEVCTNLIMMRVPCDHH